MSGDNDYAGRCRELMNMIGDNAVAMIGGARELIRNNDVHYPFRQDSDFWYLTGFDEPDALLVLVPGRDRAESILFCRERDPEREVWDGPRAGVEGARTEYGFDDAFPIDDIDEILPGLLEGRERVYYNLGRESDFDQRVIGWVKRAAARGGRSRAMPEELVSVAHPLHEMRLIKSRPERERMKKAANISADAHRRLMRAARPGCNERELHAELLHEFCRRGCACAYLPIVAGGANACILHYIRNDQAIGDGDLVLVDAGCEYDKYAADITRTFPVNGRFTPEQRAIYDIVLAAQLAAIERVRADCVWSDVHDAAVDVIARGLVDLGILQGSPEQVIENGDYRRFFMHKTGHWLGLDVHDVGDYQVEGQARQLERGMVMTVEPGIYIPPGAEGVDARWHCIGVRIEDDVAVSRRGPEVLSDRVPKQPDEIEALLAD